MEQTILKQRFPQIELSYETDAHNKVLNSKYDICMSIPTGKKYYAWFSYEPCKASNASYIIDKQGLQFTQINVNAHHNLHLGTVVYGTVCELSTKFFIIEDIYFYCGLSMKQMTFANKMSYAADLFNSIKSSEIAFVLPYITTIQNSANIFDDPIFYDSMIDKTAYLTHHVQFRSSTHIMPYLNHNYKKNTSKTQIVQSPLIMTEMPRQDIDYMAASRKSETVFLVSADIDDDIYHLYCYDNKSDTKYTYLDIAYIGTRKESSYMNSLFRNIRENSNIDLGEESEDEDMFQNVNLDKYVDLSKRIKMNCIFHNRWRKWVPASIAPNNAKVVNISELIKSGSTFRPAPTHHKHRPIKVAPALQQF